MHEDSILFVKLEDKMSDFNTFRSAVAATLALAVTSTASVAETVKWDMAIIGVGAFRVAGEALAEYVNTNSDGDFTITLHQDTLSPAREILDNLSVGAFELGYVISSYHPGKNPLISTLDLPFLPIQTMEQRAAVAEALFDHEDIISEFGRWNTVPIMAVVQPNYEIIGKGTPPTSLDVFDGMRVKATSGIGDALGHFGTRLISMTGAEQYNGLQTGVIDAVAATYSAFGGFNLYELTDWYTVGMDAGTAHVTVTANRDAYESLSDEHKALLDEATVYAYAKSIEAQLAATAENLPIFDEYNLQRVEIPAEQVEQLRSEAAQPVWDAYIESLESRGLPGQAILDFVIAEAEKVQD